MTAGSTTLSDINFVEQLVIAAAAANLTPAQLGASTIPSTATATTQAAGDSTTKVATTAFVHNAGGWDLTATVVTADATTTAQALADITGLTAAVVAASTYEFEAILKVVASADTNGMKVGVACTQTPVTVAALVTGNTATTTAVTEAIIAAATANATLLNTSSAGIGLIRIVGQIVTHATLAGVLSIQFLKGTSGTATVKIGSSLKVRKVA